MTIEPAGFVVSNEYAIWGIGDTKESAWQYFMTDLAKSGIRLVDKEYEDMPCEIYTEAQLRREFGIRPATAGLIAAVQDRGGNIGWNCYNGILCTDEEYETA